MPFVYDLEPKKKVYALLISEEFRSIVPENNRLWWHLYFYTSERNRLTAAKKKKRHSPEAIFITWEFMIEDIISQGKWLLVQPSEKILLTDKLDILKQMGVI